VYLPGMHPSDRTYGMDTYQPTNELTEKSHISFDDNGFVLGEYRANYSDLVLKPFYVAVMSPPKQTYLIEDYLPAGKQGMLIGKSTVGKTFFALDLALSIACGKDFNGKPAQKGRVIYVAAEGADSISVRMRGWVEDKGISIDHSIGMELYDRPVNLLSETGFEELMEHIYHFDDLALIVLDTLHACTAGSDENSSADMGNYLSACKHLTARTGATVLTVHHPGYSNPDRARGSSSLFAGLDFNILMKPMEIVFNKIKDSRLPASIPYKRREVSTSWGMSTLVLDYNQVQQSIAPLKTTLAASSQQGLDIFKKELNGRSEMSIADWKNAYTEFRKGSASTGAIKTAFTRCKKQLLDEGYISITGDSCSLV